MMRAKVKVTTVSAHETCEEVIMHPVSSGVFDSHGVSEDNTFAKYTPSGEVKLTINNPDLIGKIKPGQTYYVDFTQRVE
jgi:mannose-6-phosphate isomerase-like protein (cupin superfamily)